MNIDKKDFKDLPIGIFDSGLGGLTTLKEIRQVLPGEDLIYFGDTARVPYGTRSRDTIIRYAASDIRFLLSLGVKAIIAACGTVSTVALEKAGKDSPVYIEGVLQSAVNAAVSAAKGGKIAVLGTPSTIKSGAYEDLLLKKGAKMVKGVACPLFVPLVENGYFERTNKIAQLAVEDCLKDIKAWNPRAVILGCTHYPLLSPLIKDFLGENVILIDAGREIALSTAARLNKLGLLSDREKGESRYYVSDSPEQFSYFASIFLEKNINTDVTLVDIECK